MTQVKWSDFMELVLESWKKVTSPVKMQLDFFNHMMESLLPNIVAEHNNLQIEAGFNRHVISFENLFIHKPVYTDCNGQVQILTPQLAIAKKLDYFGEVTVVIKHEFLQKGVTITSRKDVAKLGVLPIMVASRYCHLQTLDEAALAHCPFNDGGYFIVNGCEKVIITQEHNRSNYPIIMSCKKQNKLLTLCEVRSLHGSKLRSTSTLKLFIQEITKSKTEHELLIDVPFLTKVSMPMILVFRMIGFASEEQGGWRQVYDFIMSSSPHKHDNAIKDFVSSLCQVNFGVWCKLSDEQVLDWMSRHGKTKSTKRKRESEDVVFTEDGKFSPLASTAQKSVLHIFNNEFLPHIEDKQNSENTNFLRGFYLGYIIKQTVLHFKKLRIPVDDRDHLQNKMYDTPGMLIGLLLRQCVRAQVKNMVTVMQKFADSGRYFDAVDALNKKFVTNPLRSSISTGKWGLNKQKARDGVAQQQIKLNPHAALGHTLRINNPLKKEGKLFKPRQLIPSHWGQMDCVATPEGKPCGLIKSPAMMMESRIGYDPEFLFKLVALESHVIPIPSLSSFSSITPDIYLIFVNGCPSSMVKKKNAIEFVESMRYHRRQETIPFDTSIVFMDQKQEIWINCDAGYCVRPVIRVLAIPEIERYFGIKFTTETRSLVLPAISLQTDVPGLRDPMLWLTFRRMGWIEYLTKNEEIQTDIRIATSIDDLPLSTHIEIDPNVIMGRAALLIPFANHNQAPRLIYQTNMDNQAIGKPTLGSDLMTEMYELDTVQIPVVSTLGGRLFGHNQMPCGQNLIIAVLCKALNMEDGAIVDQRPVDLGMMRVTCYHSHIIEEKNNTADQELISKPDLGSLLNYQAANFSKLADNGIMKPHSVIESGDVVVGKVMITKNLGSDEKHNTLKRDRSLVLHPKEHMHLDKAVIQCREGDRMVTVRTRVIRDLEEGDKVDAKGQKQTVSHICPHEDMPFTASGLTPNLIINEHSIPSRMTGGLLHEAILGAAAAMEGRLADGTAFRGISAEAIGEVLLKHGMHPRGNHTLYDGRTGRPLGQGNIFMGPVFYQRLKHMVVDKIHARNRGPKDIKTNQPLSGRANHGGLKFGGMEVDAGTSHGVAFLIQDRGCFASDAYEVFVCSLCGIFISQPLPESQKVDLNNLWGLMPSSGTQEPLNFVALKEMLAKTNVDASNVLIQQFSPEKAACHSCKKGQSVLRKVVIPYSLKLLIHSLAGCGFFVKIKTS